MPKIGACNIHSCPPNIISHEIILPKCQIKTIFSFASTSKKNYTTIIKAVEGLWDRDVTPYLHDYPYLIFFQIIDGCRKTANAFNEAEDFFKKTRRLFSEKDTIDRYINKNPLKSSLSSKYSIYAIKDIKYSNFTKFRNKDQKKILTKLEKAIESINNLDNQVFARISLPVIAGLIDGFWFLLYLPALYHNDQQPEFNPGHRWLNNIAEGYRQAPIGISLFEIGVFSALSSALVILIALLTKFIQFSI